MHETEKRASYQSPEAAWIVPKATWMQEIADQGNRAWENARNSIHQIIRRDEAIRLHRYIGLLEAQREGTKARDVIHQQINDMRARAVETAPSISQEHLDAYIRAHQPGVHAPLTDSVPSKPSPENPVRSFLLRKIHPISRLRSD